VTRDAALEEIAQQSQQVRSTAGMTTKVVKGSMWTLAGQIAPFAVSFVSTPFIIRFLGSEAYGVLILVGLIPTYFAFADFGMGIASTKFASEAFGQGDEQKEAQVVWTAAAIALIASSIVAIPIFAFSSQIVGALNVPEHLLTQASIALRIAAAAFVLGVLGSVVNSPMLARLRMDLNTITAAVPKVLLAAVTPFILYFGGGIVEAVSWAFIVGVATLAVVVYFSGRLLPEMFRAGVSRDLFRPLLKFGGAWVVAMVAAMLLVNLEKLFLTKLVSVKALAYYSVAFTFANMATMFSQALIQSLIPAFSQLLAPEKRREFDALFARSIRLNFIWLLPALMVMFVVAKPFFTIWAGEEFGRNSTLPSYVLLVGLFFNLQATVPYIAILAVGRTDVFARLYWIELVVYAAGAFLLINSWGIIGAALGWTLRVCFDAFIIVHLSERYAGAHFKHIEHLRTLILATVVLVPPVVVAVINGYSVFLLGLVPMCVAIYAFVVWRRLIDADEKRWIIERYRRLHV
jgi:O-antigen/teichoic acid export membrane protein